MAKRVKKITDVSVQEKFAIMREDMNVTLIERHDEIDMVLTALIAQEHPLLVGPPGTGKSLLLDSLATWMGGGASTFAVLFNKFTVPEEVFGPISVQGLKNDQYRRITTNKLPEAHFAFADEIFKASSAILNTMLRILNERQFDNGDGSFRDCPLLICVAASNEWPGEGGKELGALFDRFLFRKTVKTVSKGGRARLLWERNHTPTLRSSITPEELHQAHDEAKAMTWTERAKETFEAILDALNKEGIFPGDRRMYKAVMAAQAFAYLSGADEVEPIHLDVIRYVLWEDPAEQAEKCGQIVSRMANPVGARILELLAQAEDIIAKNPPTEAVTRLQQVRKDLDCLADHDRKKPAMEFVSGHIKALYNRVIGV